MERTYIGLIHKEPSSDYGVSFPDFPGCITAGDTLEKARTMAAEALALHIEGMASSGLEIPKPSSADAVVAHPDACDAIALVVVKALPEYAEIQESL
ncbi:MAG: type II toxin-antitoxin system HicB family antitoxin [Candidatus Latescibacteria bacterium]|nr:type II toxin-antitoxin system HicB family antitoxin [Candidatus Latescibacterota bacterium]